VKSPPTRGTCANGSRSSNHCGDPSSEPIRYTATNPTSTPHAIGVSRGVRPNNTIVNAAVSQAAGSWAAALTVTSSTLPPTSPAAMP